MTVTNTMNRELPETVLVGRVVKAHGLRGEVLVEELSDVDGRFEGGRQVMLLRADGAFDRETISRVGGYKGRLLVGFVGCDDRDRAESWRGREIHVRRDDVPAAPEGEFYYFHLIGCDCNDVEAGDLGRVQSVIEDGGGLLLEVERGGGKLLIPFVRSYVRRVDVERGEIDLELPPGLLETCESTS
jgi:16S rRNA processing protein RimM